MRRVVSSRVEACFSIGRLLPSPRKRSVSWFSMNASTEAGLGVEEVVYEVIVYAVQSRNQVSVCSFFGGVYLVEEAEVHNGLEVTVLGG